MSKQLVHKYRNRALRARRVRSQVTGTAERPRLSVHVTNRHVIAQLIDDTAAKTLAYVTTVGSKPVEGNMSERAAWVGTQIGKKAKTAKIKQAVFDRGSKLYHGRVKALADAARNEGLEF